MKKLIFKPIEVHETLKNSEVVVRATERLEKLAPRLGRAATRVLGTNDFFVLVVGTAVPNPDDPESSITLGSWFADLEITVNGETHRVDSGLMIHLIEHVVANIRGSVQ